MTNTPTSDQWQGKCNYGTPGINNGNPGMIPNWGGVYGTNQNENNTAGYDGFRNATSCGFVRL